MRFSSIKCVHFSPAMTMTRGRLYCIVSNMLDVFYFIEKHLYFMRPTKPNVRWRTFVDDVICHQRHPGIAVKWHVPVFISFLYILFLSTAGTLHLYFNLFHVYNSNRFFTFILIMLIKVFDILLFILFTSQSPM